MWPPNTGLEREMKIEVLGPGCSRCETLAENARAAAESLGVDYELIKVSDLAEIAGRGVMVTPALIVEGALKSSGKVLGQAEIEKLLRGD